MARPATPPSPDVELDMLRKRLVRFRSHLVAMAAWENDAMTADELLVEFDLLFPETLR